jgi:LysM domain
MTNPGADARARQAADRTRTSAPRARLALGTVLIALIAAGCLPSGRRGEGSGPTGSDTAPSATIGPSPSSSGPTQRPTIVAPTPTPRPTFLVHVVVQGDSLDTIAQRYGTTARSIAFWNRATYPSLDPESAGYRPNLLKLGWTLFLIPNDTVDEQNLPDPSPSSDGAGAPSLAPVDSVNPA